MELYKLVAVISASVVAFGLFIFIFSDLFRDMRALKKRDAVIESMENRKFKLLKGKKATKKKPVKIYNRPMLRKIK